MANVLEMMDYVTQQGEKGRARGMENAFRRDSMAALQGDQDAFLRQAAIDPAAAVQTQQAGDVNAKRIRGAAKYMQQALESQNPAQAQGAWNAVRPYLSKVTGKGAPEAWDDGMRPAMEQLLAKTAYLELADANGMPAGFREFQMTAAAAGLKPGTPEYQQAANIALGREGRAATGGFGFEMFKGLDGRERPGRQNPRTGEIEIYNETTGNFEPIGAGRGLGLSGGTSQRVPVGPMGAAAAPMPTGGTQAAIDQIMASANQMIASGIPEAQVNAWVQQQANPAGGASRPATAPAPQMVQTGGPLPPAIDYQRGGLAANPGLGVSRTPEEQAAATARAQEEVELRYLPARQQIETQGAVDRARQESEVKMTADRAAGQYEKDAALRLYETGMQGLGEGLAGATTGPLVGLLPAVTTEQQIAEGGVAAMAPILKQLFRSAGEGTFTDKDQDLLMAMIPTRTDTPGARAAKLQNIDRIVRAKLSAPSQQGGAPIPVRSASDYEAVPSGALYMAPDGSVRRKR